MVGTPTAAEQVKALYQAGRLTAAIALADATSSEDPRVRLIKAVAVFDRGNGSEGLSLLRSLCADLVGDSEADSLSAEFSLFSRESAFQTPSETSARLVTLRQAATSIGRPSSLAGLHLAVAKIEALRGSSCDARAHLEIARRLALDADSRELRCSIELISASPFLDTGSIDQARRAAIRAFEGASSNGLQLHLAGALGNMGLSALYLGNPTQARHYLTQARSAAGEMSFVQLALVDTLANVALYEGDLEECRRYLDEADSLIQRQRVPARSWYDLAHQITRCLYLGSLMDWPAIIDIANAAHPELDRRRLRVWDTSLLAAKAKAQAHLGLHEAANATLFQALRVCPRGAVDPLITIEAATGTCLVLRGDRDRGARHFDRALRACQAISHRFQEWIVTSERDRFLDRGQWRADVDRRRYADTEDTNLILTDVSAMLGAGHSIDVMAQRLTAIVATTALRSRLDISSVDIEADDSHWPVEWETANDGTQRIVLTDAGRRVVLSFRAVQSLEDVSLVRNLVDIAKSAANQTGNSQQQDEELLWPQVSLPSNMGAIFWSPRMQEFLRVAMRLAASELPILITGETGTGKEVVARLIHENSKWARGPFVPFNVSALSKDLVESQMFGFRRGAFTGAVEASGGVIRAAEHGTLFLDEIGDLDISLQPKLLRFLESGEVHPLGESRSVQTRVRVVAATNADLRALVASQRFRSDLFYRLDTATLTLPPLRDRKDEIPALAALYVRKACKESGRQHLNVADDFIAALLLHDWPGNIRQLANEIRRVVALAEDGATVSAQNLSPDIVQRWASRNGAAASRDTGPTVTVRVDQPLERALDEVERAFLERALTQTRGHVSDAARLLGISRKGLFLKRKKLGLE